MSTLQEAIAAVDKLAERALELEAENAALRAAIGRVRSLPIVWKVSADQSDSDDEMQAVEADYEAMYAAAMAVLFPTEGEL